MRITREKAIKIIDKEKDYMLSHGGDMQAEAFDMAISALKQESNRDMEEIAEVLQSDTDAKTKCKMISNILSAKPHYFEVEQEPCDDAISREDKKHIDGFKYWCETNEENGTITIPKFVCDEIVKILDNFSSVTPSRPKGHWIKTPLLTCDRCNKINKSGIESDFCPNCGCKMVGDINANSN